MRHPFFYALARRQAARQVKGYRLRDVNDVLSDVTDDVIDAEIVALNLPPMVGAIGDGSIIQAILDFFKSPEGQALIAALVKMLLGLLAGL
jgi:hypothetical protein